MFEKDWGFFAVRPLISRAFLYIYQRQKTTLGFFLQTGTWHGNNQPAAAKQDPVGFVIVFFFFMFVCITFEKQYGIVLPLINLDLAFKK